MHSNETISLPSLLLLTYKHTPNAKCIWHKQYSSDHSFLQSLEKALSLRKESVLLSSVPCCHIQVSLGRVNWEYQEHLEGMNSVLEVVSLNATATLLKTINPICISLPNHEMWTLGSYKLYGRNYKRENGSLDM